MSNHFFFDGRSCSEFEIICSNGGTYGAPERDVKIIEVPGRNGSLTIDNGRWKNAPVKFQCYVRKNFAQVAPQIRAWLHRSPGYRRLEDDAHPDEYRMARFVKAVEFEPMYTDREADLEIVFDCMPQRYLKSGEDVVTKNSNGYITNQTEREALPLITVYGTGSGTLTVGSYAVAISDIGTSVTLDCEVGRAYNGTTARDSTITGPYPRLAPGRNNIRFAGGITSVDIVPRWWII